MKLIIICIDISFIHHISLQQTIMTSHQQPNSCLLDVSLHRQTTSISKNDTIEQVLLFQIYKLDTKIQLDICKKTNLSTSHKKSYYSVIDMKNSVFITNCNDLLSYCSFLIDRYCKMDDIMINKNNRCTIYIDDRSIECNVFELSYIRLYGPSLLIKKISTDIKQYIDLLLEALQVVWTFTPNSLNGSMNKKSIDIPKPIKNTTLLKKESNKSLVLSDIASIKTGLQTNRKNIFIHQHRLCNETCWKKIQMNAKDIHYIIYPYDNQEKIIPEHIFQSKYPQTYNYLLKNKDKLETRKHADEYDSWYAYTKNGHPINIPTSQYIIYITRNNQIKIIDYKICNNPILFESNCIGVIPHKEYDNETTIKEIYNALNKHKDMIKIRDKSSGYTILSKSLRSIPFQ